MKQFIVWAQAFALSIGGLGLFVVAFVDASVLSLPEINDVLIVYMVTKHPPFLLYYAAMATAGSIAGSLVVFYLGRRAVRRCCAGSSGVTRSSGCSGRFVATGWQR